MPAFPNFLGLIRNANTRLLHAKPTTTRRRVLMPFLKHNDPSTQVADSNDTSHKCLWVALPNAELNKQLRTCTQAFAEWVGVDPNTAGTAAPREMHRAEVRRSPSAPPCFDSDRAASPPMPCVGVLDIPHLGCG